MEKCHSSLFSAQVLFNSLPETARLCTDCNTFKTPISFWDVKEFKCSICLQNNAPRFVKMIESSYGKLYL